MELDCFIELFIELLLRDGHYKMKFTAKLEQLFEAVKAVIRALPLKVHNANSDLRVRAWPGKKASKSFVFKFAGTPNSSDTTIAQCRK
jgi:hypothetical protein